MKIEATVSRCVLWENVMTGDQWVDLEISISVPIPIIAATSGGDLDRRDATPPSPGSPDHLGEHPHPNGDQPA